MGVTVVDGVVFMTDGEAKAEVVRVGGSEIVVATEEVTEANEVSEAVSEDDEKGEGVVLLQAELLGDEEIVARELNDELKELVVE